ncbi:MAG: MtrB/PioB family decaheme-associated outer membrane protein [Alphaproteobacteria bacterium]|nr:MtrB/PioB family decaheme-associated outer membrane protein [Alphaproteobacteria bacterium]MDE2163419.1 MtrB/PioB family decaheme-associated outer membrane protein [Alphaproteobacteria bacterium]
MNTIQTLRAAALASACLLPLTVTAQAQDSNAFDVSDAPATPQATVVQNPSSSIGEVTIGVGGVSDPSAAFGRYNGMPNSGIGVLGSWNLGTRDAWDSGGTHYFTFTGDNVNIGFGKFAPEASIDIKTGEQGKWSVSASYDAMTYAATDNFTTILDKEGNLAPGYSAALAANGAYLNNSPTSTSFYGSYRTRSGITSSSGTHVGDYGPATELTYQIGTRRDKGTVSGSYDLGFWKLSASASREHKEGSLEQSMTTGGSNTGMVTFPMPIDYDTDNYVVSAAYSTPDLQASISYEYSNFIDHNKGGYAFEGWNFTAIQDPVTHNYTSYQQSGVYALPPSNQAHTVTGEIGYNLSPTTRLYGTMVYGVQLQNDPFPAATQMGYAVSNPALAVQLASNPGSLDGMVQTFFSNVAVSSRPLPKLDVRASYKIDVRDPQTKAMWIYGDPTDTTSFKYREAVPESWTKQEVELTAGYHVLESTRVTVGYTYRNEHRGNAITHDTQENAESVKVNSTLPNGITGSLGYVHSDRTASTPDYSLWLVQIASDCGSTLDSLGCQQIPFYEAARTEDAVTGMVSGMIGQKTSVSFFGKYSNDQYHSPQATYSGVVNPSLGINHDYSVQAGPDMSYQVSPDEEVHAYYTFLRTYRAMRALNDGTSTTAPGTYYSEASTYDINTAGIGGTWRANDKLKFGADYIYSYGDQAFAQSGSWTSGEAGQTYGGDPLLTTASGNHQVKVHATYDYSANTSFYFSYQFTSLDMNDWALVGASVGQVLTGDVPAKYDVSTFMAAMTLKL